MNKSRPNTCFCRQFVIILSCVRGRMFVVRCN